MTNIFKSRKFWQWTGGAVAVVAISVVGLIALRLETPHTTTGNIGNPENVQIITTDYEAFWHAYDTSKNADGTLNKQAFAEKYNPSISPRLAEFSGWRYMDKTAVFQTAHMADFYNTYRNTYPPATYYKREPIIAGYKNLRQYLPNAPLPHVSIFMGQMNNGGTVVSDAIIIGHEMAIDWDKSDWSLHPKPKIRPMMERMTQQRGKDPAEMILHELIHYIQLSKQTPWQQFTMKFRMIERMVLQKGDLLEMAMQEGIANFLMSVIHQKTGEFTQIRDAWVRQNNNETALWNEFNTHIAQGKVGKETIGQWMYSFNTNNRPKDMGYWMGEKIAQSYWNNTPDKKQAFRDLIYARTSDDFKTILQKSGYTGNSLGGQ